MYTQCPECHIAFRVTAEILRQAAGKVRCGGCGVAFNALEYLSEQKPQAPVRDEPEPQLPELTPDEPVELEADEPPATISAEQSAALLKTLDQLAGEDIRIEDTGVEWRVVGADEDGKPEDADTAADAGAAPPDEESGETDLIADTGSLTFFIEDDPEEEPLDEILEDSPTPVDEFLTAAPPQVDAPEIFESMRFDDNTPLPDDFDFDAPAATSETVVEAPEQIEAFLDAQVDLELGDPDDWEELLEEVDVDAEATAESASDADQADIEDAGLSPSATHDAAIEGLPDVDTQFAIQAEALGIDLSGLHKAPDQDLAVDTAPEASDDTEPETETSIDEDLIAAAFETEARAKKSLETEVEPETDAEAEAEAEFDIHGDIELDFTADAEIEPEPEPAESDEDSEKEELIPIELEETSDDAELMADFRETPVDEKSLEISLDDIDEEDEADEEAAAEYFVPELTEEEKTINMLIDQDLLSVAVEDEDGFASTIVQVQPDRKIEKELERNQDDEEGEDDEESPEPDAKTRDETPVTDKPTVETIIMEGEVVRGMHDNDKSEKNRRLGEALKARQAEEELRKHGGGASRTGLIAAAVGLGLLLILQIVHQSREALATNPSFNQSVGSIYRMLGKPLTPAWDIKGWRFEATKGSTDEMGELLTIYSRVGNNSDSSLPYPLVHVSLTDRFEDIIGSRVLEPGEYLGSDADPRQLVPAGSTFNAVISIESPSPEATGFKLNVCYRLASGQLRCAIEDFK